MNVFPPRSAHAIKPKEKPHARRTKQAQKERRMFALPAIPHLRGTAKIGVKRWDCSEFPKPELLCR